MAESEIKLTIGEEKVDSKDVTKGQEIDLKFRDPEKLHDEMRVGLLSQIFISRLAIVLKTFFINVPYHIGLLVASLALMALF